MRLLTIGHGTISAEEFTGLLRGERVARLIDIRSAPGSRHNPQFVRAAMEQWLPAAGIAYEWDRALGGFRKTSPNSLNTALRHASFRGYADYMLTQAFTTAANDLLSSVGSLPGAVMCSESVWWRCHRRLLSDYLTLVRDVEVGHLMRDTSVSAHRLTEGARFAGDHVIYDRPPATLGDVL
jgi:uncharacterized protein (DUF488 family)